MPSMTAPSGLWCTYQILKGTHNRNISTPDADLRGTWVIVTGGNNGIGREAALQFASWGANIMLPCRQPPPHETHPDVTVADCKAAAERAGHASSEIDWWFCDMADLASVEAFSKRWLATGRPLDILASNAGTGQKLETVIKTKDGFELVHQVNFLSHVMITLSLLPSLAKAQAPRIVYSTSCMQFQGHFDLTAVNSGKDAYPNNKLFLQTWLTELQYRCLQHDEYKRITMHGVHPGFVNSGIWESIDVLAKLPVDGWARRCLRVIQEHVCINPQQGSVAITAAATTPECGPDPSVQGVGGAQGRGGGRYFNRIWEEAPMPQTQDPECRQAIWTFVDEELGLSQRGLLTVIGK